MRFLATLTIAMLAIPTFATAGDDTAKLRQDVAAITEDASAEALNDITPAAGAETSDSEGQFESDSFFAEPKTPRSRRDLGQEVYFD